MRRQSTRVVLLGITSTLGLVMLGGATAHADTTTATTTDIVEIGANDSGSGSVAQFDPALGTLTSVSYTVDAEVLIQICAESNSAQTSTESGPAEGDLTVTLNGSSAVAANSFVTTGTLAATNGVDDCLAGYDAATGLFPAPVNSPDVYYHEETASDSANGSVTDPAALASWIGTGTVDFNWSGSSDGHVGVYSHWDIFFVAEGHLAVSVVYTYTPPATTTTSTTTTTTIAPTTVPNTVAEVTTTTGAPITTVATTPPTTPPGGLPSTGSDTGPMLWIATALVAGGFAAWRIGNQRRRTSTDG